MVLSTCWQLIVRQRSDEYLMSAVLTASSVPTRAPARLTPKGARALALLLACACFLGIAALWATLVLTRSGQRLEQEALAGSLIGSGFISAPAQILLSVVSIPAAVVVVLLTLASGLRHGSRQCALWATAVLLAVNASAQVLKHWLLTRPDYGLSWRYDGANTLPSGHAAMAASVGVVLIFVAPPALRAVAVWAAAVLTACMGYATLVCQWHRPEDVIAAILLAVGWAALALGCGPWFRRANSLASPAFSGQLRPPGASLRRAPAPRRSLLYLKILLWAGLFVATCSTEVALAAYLGRSWFSQRLVTFLIYLTGAGATVAISFLSMGILAWLVAQAPLVPGKTVAKTTVRPAANPR